MRAATYLSANELSLTDKAKPQVIKTHRCGCKTCQNNHLWY